MGSAAVALVVWFGVAPVIAALDVLGDGLPNNVVAEQPMVRLRALVRGLFELDESVNGR